MKAESGMAEAYPKASRYTDLAAIYAQCSGPGGLKLAEFLADKTKLGPDRLLLDVGTNRGVQTCFLAKEYGVSIVGIDPLDDRQDGWPHVQHLMHNALSWGVGASIFAVQAGVPRSGLASESFDFVYATTTLEMIRCWQGEAAYRDCLRELLRLMKPGGLLGLAEPMHFDVHIPAELVPRVAEGPDPWTNYFATLEATVEAVGSVGFEIVEADHVAEAQQWWMEFAAFDPFCQADPQGEARTIALDGGRWLSFGYVIARKAEV